MAMTRSTTRVPEVAGGGRRFPRVTNQDHSRGPVDAVVTLVEYGDYQCPYCRQARPIVKVLERRLADRTIPIRFVFRNFPLTEIHAQSLHAAEAAESVSQHAGELAFWTMHDAIFVHQDGTPAALSDERLCEYASAVGVDAALIARDLETGAHEQRIRDDYIGGLRSGVNGTPTFFINGRRYDGDWRDVREFTAALEAAAGLSAAMLDSPDVPHI